MTAAASDINDARIKRHTATWAPDDHRPRKGPHRLARSSTRRRLYVEVADADCLYAREAVAIALPNVRGSVRLELGQRWVPFTWDPPLRIYGPVARAWATVVWRRGALTTVHCPTCGRLRQRRHLP
jgi:hypothetical protein